MARESSIKNATLYPVACNLMYTHWKICWHYWGKSALLQQEVHNQYLPRASHIHSHDLSITCKRIQARQMQYENSKQALQKICIQYNGKICLIMLFISFQIYAAELLLKTLSCCWAFAQNPVSNLVAFQWNQEPITFLPKKITNVSSSDLRALLQQHIKGDSCDTTNRINTSGNFSL
jgi:hypothetical protein